MTALREINAYRRRLARIAEDDQPSSKLTAECLGAVVEAREAGTFHEIVGTLVSVTHRQALGLFGMRLATDVTLCTACVGKHGDCGPATEVVVADASVTRICRNADEDLTVTFEPATEGAAS